MRAAILPLLLAAVLASGCGRESASGRAQPKIALTESGVSLNASVVSLPAGKAALVAHLGEPSRTLDQRANRVFVWDQHGAYAMAKPGTTEVHTFGVAFHRSDYPFWPARLHAGAVHVGGRAVGAAVPAAVLREAGFRADAQLPFYWARQLGRMTVSLEMPAARRVIGIEAQVASD